MNELVAYSNFLSIVILTQAIQLAAQEKLLKACRNTLVECELIINELTDSLLGNHTTYTVGSNVDIVC